MSREASGQGGERAGGERGASGLAGGPSEWNPFGGCELPLAGSPEKSWGEKRERKKRERRVGHSGGTSIASLGVTDPNAALETERRRGAVH